MNEDVSVSSNTLHIGDEDIETPYVIDDIRQGPDHILLLFGVGFRPLRTKGDPDIVLPDPSRNVLAIDYDGNVRWRISRPPDTIPEDRYSGDQPTPYYNYLLDVDGELTVRHTNTYRYGLSTPIGRLGEPVPDNRLEVGNTTRHFPFPVRSITEVDDKYVVFLAHSLPTDFEYTCDSEFDEMEEVYCLDSTGDVLWGRSDSYVSVDLDGDQLWMDQHYKEGNWHLIDPETGEIVRTRY